MRHLPGFGEYEQVPSPLQLPVVQESPSSHEYAAPAQVPAAHTSSFVHGFPSSHVVPAVFGLFEHWPFAGLQVPPLLHWSSGHVRGAPGRQVPPTHMSPVVQALPSEQGAVSGMPEHEETGDVPGQARHW